MILDDQVIVSNPDEIIAFDIISGGITWKIPIKYFGLPATDGNKLVGDTIESIICVDIHSKSILWETQIGPRKNEPMDFPLDSSPSIARDLVYVGWRHGFIYCVGLEDGSIWWEFETGDSVVASPALSDGKMCCVAQFTK